MLINSSSRWVVRPSMLLGGLLLVLVAGYWAFSRAFGYIGYYPILIGEVAMLAGVALVVWSGGFRFPRQLSAWLFVFVFLFGLGQIIYSAWFLEQPPLEVIRSFATLYYGVYGFLAYFAARKLLVLLDDHTLARLMSKMAWAVLLGMSISIAGFIFLVEFLPFFPQTTVPILTYKPTDAIIPLLFFTVMWVRGYLPPAFMAWILALVAFAAARSRSSLAAYIAGFVLQGPFKIRSLWLIVAVFVAVSMLAIFDVRISLGYREISINQLAANALFFLEPDQAGQLDSTTTQNANWRSAWWTAIWNEAVVNEYYFMGLGWGVNLADHYGFQTVEADTLDVLRNPHNALMGILARGGWLISIAWLLTYATFLVSVAWSLARKHYSYAHRTLLIAIFVCTIANLINGATDVYLESPQVAIPHWILIGLGWALMASETRPSSAGEIPAGLEKQ